MDEVIKPSEEPSHVNVIVSQTVSGIKLNSRVFQRKDLEVVVSSENGIRRLKRIEEGVINPSKKRGQQDLDLQEYVIFWMDKSIHAGKWGGHAPGAPGFFARADFRYRIVSGDRLAPLLPKDRCISEYLLQKMIRPLIQKDLLECIKKKVNVNADISEQNCRMFVNKINESVLFNYGLEMTELELVTESMPSESPKGETQTNHMEEQRSAASVEEK